MKDWRLVIAIAGLAMVVGIGLTLIVGPSGSADIDPIELTVPQSTSGADKTVDSKAATKRQQKPKPEDRDRDDSTAGDTSPARKTAGVSGDDDDDGRERDDDSRDGDTDDGRDPDDDSRERDDRDDRESDDDDSDDDSRDRDTDD